MILKSACKINIGLNVTSRREDGYHLLESLFYPVRSLYDLVEVVRSDNGVDFSQSGIAVDCPTENNLCVKAYSSFAKRFPIKGAKIHLHKRIPFGAGIGGGSSNAATVLKLLNTIYDINTSSENLCAIASEIGSDVPFFIYDRPLIARGTGNIFSEIDITLEGKYITLIKPDFNISTAQAYSLIKPHKAEIALEEALRSDWKRYVINDFEEPIFNLYPEMRGIKERLYTLGAEYVSMSGSGSAIYTISSTPLNIKNLFQEEFCHQGKF